MEKGICVDEYPGVEKKRTGKERRTRGAARKVKQGEVLEKRRKRLMTGRWGKVEVKR